MCVIVLLSFYMWRANLALTLIECLNIHKRYPVYQVDRFHHYIPIILSCQNASPYIRLFVICLFVYSSSNVKERENPPFLSSSRRRGLCTTPYTDSNTEEGNIPKYIHGVYRAISARDHTILPSRSDKIRYFSYFHVFSIHFLILGKGGRRVWPGARLISI